MSRTPFLFLDVIPGQDRTAQLQSAIDSAADCGGTVAGVAVLIELGFLRGRELLGELPVLSLLSV